MRYTPRDLRAADMFSLILVGLGVAMMAIGVIQFAAKPSRDSLPTEAAASKTSTADAPGKFKDARMLAVPGVRLGVAGFVLGCLGTALCFKVRQLVRTGGVEPSEYGVRPAT